MTQRHLIIMVKQPQIGRVKTRLAKSVGEVEALRVYRVLLANLLRRLGNDPRWQCWIAVAPSNACFWPGWPQHISMIDQGLGNLGQRMQTVFDNVPKGPAIIIGSDIPYLMADYIWQAFQKLASHDAVLSPAGDGGYSLIGLRRILRIARPFKNVRWSSSDALDDTLAGLHDYDIYLLPPQTDLDDEDDYKLWRHARK